MNYSHIAMWYGMTSQTDFRIVDRSPVRNGRHLPRGHRRGAMLVLVAILFPILLLLAAVVINMAQIEVVRTELQISTDAAARAGGRMYAQTGDTEIATAIAREAARRNHVGGQSLLLGDDDLEFGIADRPNLDARYQFLSANANFNALRVTGRLANNSPNGPIRLWMPGVLGLDQVETSQQAVATQVELDVVIVLDRSGSMAYAASEPSNVFSNPTAAPPGWSFGDPVPTPSRWRDTVAAVDAFVNVLNQSPLVEGLGLCTYASDTKIDVPLTTSYGQLFSAMDVYTQSYQEGLTNVGGGIDSALQAFATSPNARPWATRVIVIMTDGRHNSGTSPLAAAQRAREQHVTIYTITFSAEAEINRMREVAATTLGRHYNANSPEQLIAAFTDIALGLPTLIAH